MAYARVNVTYAGSNGDLVDPVDYDLDDRTIKALVVESVTAGSVPGIPALGDVDLTDFVVDRFPATDANPDHRIFVRPKTPFGFFSGSRA